MTEVGTDPHVGGQGAEGAAPTMEPTPETGPPPPSPKRSTVRRTITVLLRYPRVTVGASSRFWRPCLRS